MVNLPFSRQPKIRALKRQLDQVSAERDKLAKQLGHSKARKEKKEDTPHKQARELLKSISVDRPTQEQINTVAPVMEAVNVVVQAPSQLKRTLFKDQDRKGMKVAVSKTVKITAENMYGGIKKGREVNTRTEESDRKAEAINQFLKRSDNSQELADQKNNGRYALTDTLTNLHIKYRAENPEEKIHYSWFCAKRDSSKFREVRYTNRQVCLCIYHANVHLAIEQCPVLPNSSEALSQLTDEQITDRINGWEKETIKFDQWEKKDLIITKRDKTKVKVTKNELEHKEMAKGDFLKHVLHLLVQFRPHQGRVVEIYRQLRFLKKHMGSEAAVVYLDYAENWPVRYKREIGEQYFNNKQVTVMPMVVYAHHEGEIKHKSFCMLSEETSHAAPTTVSAIVRLMPYLRQLVENLRVVHFVSDSPVSQFRNQTIAFFVARFGHVFPGVQATWTWMEAGHGKNACDGVGGGIKKAGNNMVKSGVIIRNSSEFNHEMANRHGIRTKMFHIKKEDIGLIAKDIDAWKTSDVVGTQKIHAMIGKGNSTVFADTPCWLPNCCLNVDGEIAHTCPVWEQKWDEGTLSQRIRVRPVPHTPSAKMGANNGQELQQPQQQSNGQAPQSDPDVIETVMPKVEEHVLFDIQNNTHVGKVVKIIDAFVQVQIYEKKGIYYQLGEKLMLLGDNDILRVIGGPRPVRGKKGLCKFDVVA